MSVGYVPPTQFHPLTWITPPLPKLDCIRSFNRSRLSTRQLPNIRRRGHEWLGHDEIMTCGGSRGRWELMTRSGCSGSPICVNGFTLPILPILTHLQNPAGCHVWLQILNQGVRDQGRDPWQSCSAYQGLSRSLLMTLIREVWRKLGQVADRPMHGVHGRAYLHGEQSDAHAS